MADGFEVLIERVAPRRRLWYWEVAKTDDHFCAAGFQPTQDAARRRVDAEIQHQLAVEATLAEAPVVTAPEPTRDVDRALVEKAEKAMGCRPKPAKGSPRWNGCHPHDEAWRDIGLGCPVAVAAARFAQEQTAPLLERIEMLVQISNVNGDWNVKFLHEQAVTQEALAERDALRAVVEQHETAYQILDIALERVRALVHEHVKGPGPWRSIWPPDVTALLPERQPEDDR